MSSELISNKYPRNFITFNVFLCYEVIKLKIHKGSFFEKKDVLAIERAKIGFQFILMTVCSFTIGALFISFLSEEFFAQSALKLSTHFETVFINCSSIREYLFSVLLYALSDIISIAIIFVVSFAVFNYIASDIVLIYNGIKTGFTVFFLYSFVSNVALTYNIGVLRYWVFAFFKAVILLLILDYSYRSAVYSAKFKIFNNTGRPEITPKVLFSFILKTLTYMGAVIILNALYCWLIYILK